MINEEVSANGTESSTTFNNNGGSLPAVTANSTSPAASKINAIKATSTGYTGIAGYTNSSNIRASGVFGRGDSVGVAGQVTGATTAPIVKVGVYGTGSNRSSTSPLGGVGVEGESDTGTGVVGTTIDPTGNSVNAIGVAGYSTSTNDNTAGVLGKGRNGMIGLAAGAIIVNSTGRVGVYGSGSNGSNFGGVGVEGVSDTSYGVYGISSGALDNGAGVGGFTLDPSNTSAIGVRADGASGYGVYSTCDGPSGWGVYGEGDSIGVNCNSINGTGVFAQGPLKAGEFIGDVDITGTLTKGGGSFKIDHPLDPANKFLSHSFVESPDMKNIYDGVVTLDAKGEAVVTLPAWFEVLNKDFRYQLTPIGAPGPNLHIASEVSNLRFKIAGGTLGMKVCWQVTGIRQDVWAQAHPIVVEQYKSPSERGHYLHPKEQGHPSDLNILEIPYAGKLPKNH